jgi:hypothetical protein
MKLRRSLLQISRLMPSAASELMDRRSLHERSAKSLKIDWNAADMHCHVPKRRANGCSACLVSKFQGQLPAKCQCLSNSSHDNPSSICHQGFVHPNSCAQRFSRSDILSDDLSKTFPEFVHIRFHKAVIRPYFRYHSRITYISIDTTKTSASLPVLQLTRHSGMC